MQTLFQKHAFNFLVVYARYATLLVEIFNPLSLAEVELKIHLKIIQITLLMLHKSLKLLHWLEHFPHYITVH